MKKIGKNAKLYLLGMLIGGIGFGLTTVVADTLINSGSVAYKSITVKAALDNLYEAADLKPKVEKLENNFGDVQVNGNTSYSFTGRRIDLGINEPVGGLPGAMDFYKDGEKMLSMYPDSNGFCISSQSKPLYLKGNPVTINGKDLDPSYKIVYWNDHKARTFSGHSGGSATCTNGVTFPTYSGYTYVGTLGGSGEGSLGLIVQPNGWCYNAASNTGSFTGITWVLLYQKSYN